MAHSCRWRFPARPGGSSNSGTGRKAGRVRVTASLGSVSESHQSTAGLGPGFDAALQVSSVIDSNLRKFRDVLGESSDPSSGEVSAAPPLSLIHHHHNLWYHPRNNNNTNNNNTQPFSQGTSNSGCENIEDDVLLHQLLAILSQSQVATDGQTWHFKDAQQL